MDTKEIETVIAYPNGSSADFELALIAMAEERIQEEPWTAEEILAREG